MRVTLNKTFFKLKYHLINGRYRRIEFFNNGDFRLFLLFILVFGILMTIILYILGLLPTAEIPEELQEQLNIRQT